MNRAVAVGCLVGLLGRATGWLSGTKNVLAGAHHALSPNHASESQQGQRWCHQCGQQSTRRGAHRVTQAQGLGKFLQKRLVPRVPVAHDRSVRAETGQDSELGKVVFQR